MAEKLGWITVGPTEFRCPICKGVQLIQRPSGKQSSAEWKLYLERKWIEHFEEHQSRKSIEGSTESV